MQISQVNGLGLSEVAEMARRLGRRALELDAETA
jgi:hypothetical protein